MLNRWIEQGLLATLEDLGVGCIGVSAFAQGELANKYVTGDAAIGPGSKGGLGISLNPERLEYQILQHVKALAGIARERGQSLAQMAIAWMLRDARVTSALVGAQTVAELDDSLDASKNLDFSPPELAEIDKHTVEVGSKLWAQSSNSVAS
jgi:L-glyceraldehyde 3-phosphate reductase